MEYTAEKLEALVLAYDRGELTEEARYNAAVAFWAKYPGATGRAMLETIRKYS